MTMPNEAVGTVDCAEPETSAPRAEPMETPTGPATLFAPFRYMFRPTMCGRVMAASPGWAIGAFLIGAFFLGLCVVNTAVVGRTREVEWDWINGGASSLIRRGYLEAWLSLGSDLFSPIAVTFMMIGSTALGAWIASLIAAWLALPIVHRSGAALRSFGRGMLATSAVVAPASVVVAAIGLAGVEIIHQQEVIFLESDDAWPEGIANTQLMVIGLIALALVLIAILGHWMRLAVMGARAIEQLPIVPLTCEACGYDLTHRPEGGRCPECGDDADDSLDPTVRRIGIDWERAPSLRTWFSANRNLIGSPERFYRRLHMRGDESLGFRFAVSNYVGIVVVSFVSITLMTRYRMEEFAQWQYMLNPIMNGTLLAGIGAWLLHTFVGAIVATLVLFRRQSRPFALISKIWQYESAYLWMFVFIGNVLGWSFVIHGTWMSELYMLVTRRNLLLEPIVMLGAIGGVLGLWLLRWRRAVLATRFANF